MYKRQAESIMPNLGLLKVHDPETNNEFWIDTGSETKRLKFTKDQNDASSIFKKKCDKINFDLIQIRNDRDYVDPLFNYFKGREKRI